MSEEKRSINIYNQILLKVLKSKMTADKVSHYGGYLSIQKMKEILVEAILEVDPCGTHYAVVNRTDDSGRSYVTLQFFIGGEVIESNTRQHYLDYQDFAKVLHEDKMTLIGKIEQQISLSQTYATRRLFTSIFGMQEEEDMEEKKVAHKGALQHDKKLYNKRF